MVPKKYTYNLSFSYPNGTGTTITEIVPITIHPLEVPLGLCHVS